jgi:putative ABC transport system permease protein
VTSTLRDLLRRLVFLLRRDRHTAELEEEVRLHLELRREHIERTGVAPVVATAAARRRFGNVSAHVERSRDAWGFERVEQFARDIRFAVRRLRQRPAFSLPVIGILALGIGATTAVFSAVDAAMLRSLPFTNARDLVSLTDVDVPFEMASGRPGRTPDLTDALAMKDVFSNAAAYAAGGLNLSDPERPLRARVGVVSETFFATLGIQPLQGRVFTSDESKPRGPLAVVLSYGLWQRQFGGEKVLGQRLSLQDKSYTIVGVMPQGFGFPSESDLWIPMTMPTTFATFEPFRGSLPARVIARVQPGVSRETVVSRLEVEWQRVVSEASGEYRANLDESFDAARRMGLVQPLQRELLGDRRRPLFILLGATGLLLLIACANVASLLLADGALRRREIAVREVLGAGRERLVRQLLAECLLLALLGAALGVALAPASFTILRAVMPVALAGVAPTQLDMRVLGFAVMLAVVTSLLFGLWPAVGATRGDATAAIKAGGGHGATAGLGRVRRLLVTAEVALTVMLLVAAGLMLRSFQRLMSERIGIVAEQVATLETSFARGTPAPERLRIITTVLDRLRGQQGVLAAGAVNDLPLRGGGGMSVTMHVPDAPPPAPGDRHYARQLYASPAYFTALGIGLVAGRTFEAADAQRSSGVVIISEKTARDWWPGRDAIGRTFSYGSSGGPTQRVIGVVADVRERSIDRDPTPQMYSPIGPEPPMNVAIVVRGRLPDAVLLQRLQDAMHEVAPTQPTYNVRMMDAVIRASVTPRRVNTILIVLFASLALILSALGIYAVVGYGVAQRTREFGIRAALGARSPDLIALVSRDMSSAIAIGLVIGLASALALSRVLASLLYGVDSRDPATFLAVPLVLVLPALSAILVPAFRATRVNPTDVIRAD